MTALTTRMTKMVAARRLVTEASPGSTSNAFTRARKPAGEAVDWLSVTATGRPVLGIAAACGHCPIYQPIVKNRLGDGRMLSSRRKPGPVPQGDVVGIRWSPSFRKTGSCGYGFRLSPERQLVQIHIVLIRLV